MTREQADGTLKEFAHRLRALREERRLSMRTLADLAHVSTVTIYKWEHGQSEPQSRNVPALATALGVPVSALIEPLVAPPGTDEALIVPANGETHSTRRADSPSANEALAEVIAQAKLMIARVAGSSPDKISIRLDF